MAGENSRIYKLLDNALNNGKVFLPEDEYANQLVKECLDYFSQDNICTTISNLNGFLCSTYPVQLIIPIHQKLEDTVNGSSSSDQSSLASQMLSELILKGRAARTRGRFPIPVLLLGDKYVCRSSTLARSPEVYSRAGYQYLFPGEISAEKEEVSQRYDAAAPRSSAESDENCTDSALKTGKIKGNLKKVKQIFQQSTNGTKQNKEWLVDKMRNVDVDILHSLKVNLICDFMVENKKVKFGMNVTSSEKVDSSNRYSDFTLVSIPYPGCEFFADYTQNHYTGEGLQFDWQQAFIDAELNIPHEIKSLLDVTWKDYVHWDLVTLTKNYMKLLLQSLLRENTSGILIHCISGWDRTPLFASLLRLSLWADGLIHQSLNAEEIVYLTLAYDWFLFSHQFTDRINKNEEIMHFCFDFLKVMSAVEFSVLPFIEGKQNPFAYTSQDNLEDVFVLENVSNTTDAECLEYKRSKETDHCEISNPTNSQNGIGDLQNGDVIHQASDLQEVETCLNGMVIDSAGFSANHHHASMVKTAVEGSDPCEDVVRKVEATAAMPPLVAELTENLNAIALKNVTLYPTASIPSDKIRSFRDDLVSPLSSSFDTAKANMFTLQQESSLLGTSQKGLVNSLDCLDSRTKHPKSEPICVPDGRKKRPMDSVVCSDSANSSLSTAAVAAESLSSWQMVSPPSIHGSAVRLDAASSTSSDTPPFSCDGTYISAYDSKSEDVGSLKQKLKKRKEKLYMASNIVIPAYCAVVQKQKLRQQQEGSFSALMGTIVGMVKRT